MKKKLLIIGAASLAGLAAVTYSCSQEATPPLMNTL